MSTAQKTLIDAIRRIALDPEALASALGDLQKRGVIDGVKTTLGGYNELQDDCCTEGDGNPADGDITDELPDIDGDAPPEVPGIGEEDVEGDTGWTDCETGEPISFAPGGFPRPETCKDCEQRPDETWREGRFWRTNTLGVPPYSSPSAYQVADKWIADMIANGSDISMTSISVGETTGRFFYVFNITGLQGYIDLTTLGCTPSDYESGICTTSPPLLDDCEDWESDNTTSYTLVNGCITASSCDPDASTQSQQCNECITICNEDGEERRVCAIGNGQWILYDPTGEHKGGRYDATGERQEILDAGETGGYLGRDEYDGSYEGGTIGGGDGWVWS